MHVIVIADAYVATVEGDGAGHICTNLLGTEPDCHQVSGGDLLTPDLYILADVREA